MGNKENINLVIMDNQILFREGLKHILESNTSFNVTTEEANDIKTLDIIKKHIPDVLLKGLNISDLEGMRDIIRCFPEMKIINMPMHNDRDYVLQVIESGVHGYLPREVDENTLIQAIKSACDGGIYLHPQMSNVFLQEYRKLHSNSKKKVMFGGPCLPVHLLTKRECEVLQEIAKGKSNNDIAETLYISVKTVKNHVSNIMGKINVGDRTQAVILAIKKGWVNIF